MKQALNGGETLSKEWPLEDFAHAFAPALFDELPLGRYTPPAQSSRLPAYTEAEIEAALDSLTEQEQE